MYWMLYLNVLTASTLFIFTASAIGVSPSALIAFKTPPASSNSLITLFRRIWNVGKEVRVKDRESF